jgi:uncharacterized protein (DUF488 family)
MHIRLLTIGFTQKTAEQFFTLLSTSGVRKLLDVRENRGGQLAGFAKEADLRYFVPRLMGGVYDVEPLLAPTRDIRRAYIESDDWSAYEKSFHELMLDRRIIELLPPSRFADPTALLCSEPTAEKCHRRLVVEHLAAAWRNLGHSVTIEHLAANAKLPRRRPT